ncbi:hypothetical protein DMC63_37675, partial [Streptomyces sp. WAC 05977]
TGGTVYQSDTVIDRAADILLSSPAVQEPTMKNCLGCRVPAGTPHEQDCDHDNGALDRAIANST